MNYMNLATARSTRRAREVGLRKVVGSRRLPLIMQFLSESIVLTFISIILSIIILVVLLPKFNMLAGKSIRLACTIQSRCSAKSARSSYCCWDLWRKLSRILPFTMSPLTVLKGEITQGSAGSLFRKILVVIQFTVSVIMIICTMVVFRQLNYLKTMDQGFDQSNIIGLQLNNQVMIRKYPVLKQILLENQNIKYVTSTNTAVGEGSGKYFDVETDQGMTQKGVNFAVVDHDFVETLGIKMAS